MYIFKIRAKYTPYHHHQQRRRKRQHLGRSNTFFRSGVGWGGKNRKLERLFLNSGKVRETILNKFNVVHIQQINTSFLVAQGVRAGAEPEKQVCTFFGVPRGNIWKADFVS